MFSMNIVTVDFFMSKPVVHFDPAHSTLRNHVVQRVPVIRVFGNTTEGKKTCIFIHGVFPYLYIPFPHEPVTERILQQLATSIDKALNIALCYKDTMQHVFYISVTKKTSMYGYNENEQTFLKIFLYEPFHVSKLEDLLLNGAVFNERFQPYESHIPYILQFCMDYNLYGMSYIKFSQVKLRTGKEGVLPKLSYCEVEGDVKAEHINIDLTTESEMKNPGLIGIWKDEEERRRKLGKSSTITPQCSQVRFAKEYNTEKIFRKTLKKNMSTYKKRNRSVLNTSGRCSLDDTFVQDDLNCTLDNMILDQLNMLAEDIPKESNSGIDEDSILGTQVIKEEETGENWTHELHPILTEESFCDVDVTLTNNDTSIPGTEHQASQDLFEDLQVQSDELTKSDITSSDENNIKLEDAKPSSQTLKLSSSSDMFALGSSDSSLTIVNENISIPVNASLQLEKLIVPSRSFEGQSSDHSLSNLIKPNSKPISRQRVTEELIQNGVINILSREAFYSNVSDIGINELQNKHLHLLSAPVSLLKEHTCRFSGLTEWRQNLSLRISGDVTKNIEHVMNTYQKIFGHSTLMKPIRKPPSNQAVSRWLKCKEVLKTNVIKSREITVEKQVDSPSSSEKGVIKLECFGSSQSSDDFSQKSPESSRVGSNRKGTRLSFDSDMFPSSPSSDSCEATQNKDVSSNDSIHKDLMKSFIRKQLVTPKLNMCDSYAIDAMTPNTTGDFQMGLENLNEVTSHVEDYYLTVLAVEIHAISRALLKPDPAYDEVKAIFYYLYKCPPVEDRQVGVLLVGDCFELKEVKTKPVNMTFVTNEKELFVTFIEKVRQWDPDILLGYETETLSWGYLLERGYILEINLNKKLSRICEVEKSDRDEIKKDDFKSTQLKIAGRIVINLWRLLRHEVTLQSYTFENIMYHVLHERVPLHSYKLLTSWWEHRTRLYKWMTVEHYLKRVTGIIRLIDQLDLIGRTSELARLFGIQFYEVLSRGSQFRVESMMLRLARLNNFVALSPSVKQRAHMRAPESLPLILEPESRMYADPIIVLDFQSLYPSVIIAYNYCFSTCLGRVEHLGVVDDFPFGCVNLNIPFETLKTNQDHLSISPVGVAFVNKSVRCGILPKMLQEILDTRLMVKQSMKEYKKKNVALQRVLHARQLGLKLIANVTYGYTAANFSGRMPCIEVGDSVVSKGRETLHKAIETVNNTKKWQCRVVYGDTDSMFVLAPGKTKEEAFEIGKEIAEVVTNNNPTPVKLKFEKVYQPCILQTKKRYVGFMYETQDQKQPVYEAKGIETVRRDGCPAVSKILKKSLCILFETKDLSAVKQYVEKQFSKIVSGRVSIQDLTFAKEYRGMAGYKPGACVPALSLARNWLATDARAEPRVGERVPYVVVAGAPGLPLIKLVKSPHELLEDFSLRPNAEYYITRVIVPPLERCLLLLGTPVLPWYTNLPRKLFVYLPSILTERKKKNTISQYFATVNCVCCNQVTQNKKGVCDTCLNQPQLLATCLYYKIHAWQRSRDLVSDVCTSCVGRSTSTDCMSLDCPVLYKKAQINRDLEQLSYVLSLCDSHLSLF